MRAVGFAVIRRHFDFQIGCAFDDVLVGDDVTGRIDNEPGTETLQRLPDLARMPVVVAEELRVKIFNRIAHRAADYALSVDVHDRRQNFRDREHRWFSRGIGLGKGGCRSYERHGADRAER